MRRSHLVCVGIVVAIAATITGAVNASAGGIVSGTTSQTSGVVGGATGTVKDTTGTVTGTVNDATGTVKDTTGSVTDTTGSTLSGGGGDSGTTGTGTTGTGTTGTSTTGTTTTTTTGTSGTTTYGTTGSGTSGEAGPGGPAGHGGTSGRGRGDGQGNGGTSLPRRPMAMPQKPRERPNGVPTKFNPTLSIATPKPSPLGMPSFLISQFEIPPFLLPVYQACGTQYGIPWQVLASINKIETAFGTNLNVSTAGAVGWMQFMPSTWKGYGVDANGDGQADPYNPVDAICSAARYLQANGGDTDLRRAIFAYNHATWYVDEVILYAQQYGKLPEELIGSLTGLTEGNRFPVAAKSRYAEEPGPASPTSTPQGIDIYSREGAPVVAVNDGTVKRIGHSSKLGNYLVLEDDYGNRFTYAELGSLRPARKQSSSNAAHRTHARDDHHGSDSRSSAKGGGFQVQLVRRRLYALPARPHNLARATVFGQLQPRMLLKAGGTGTKQEPTPRPAGALHRGSRVSAGTLLGRVGKADHLAPHINFAIQPTGIGNAELDPKPILDGWQLLHDTAIYSAGQNPLRQAARPSDAIGDLLMPSSALARKALADPRLSIYRCGRMDIRHGKIDRRVLATMNFLVDNGFRLSITSLKCDPGQKQAQSGGEDSGAQESDTASEHSEGDAMEISRVDSLPVAGHQGPGSAADDLIRMVLQQQGVMEPARVTSHENLPGPVSVSAPGQRGRTIDIGFTPLTGSGYQNPFPHAIKGRIDMGVDYVGTGPINAIGNARILQIGAPGWPNGGAGPAGQGVLYRLLDGPQAGKIIYVYEGITPTVRTGQEVVAGERIATFYPGSSIEIGFADTAGAPLAHEHYVEGKVTAWGTKMSAFLATLGAPGKLDHQFAQMLAPQEWKRVIAQLDKISNPNVPKRPSHFAEPAQPRGSGASGPTGPGP